MKTQSTIHNPQSTIVLTSVSMREADRRAIEAHGIPGFTLMESAGRAAADRIEQRYGPMMGRRVACFCGKGNNGGDGFVVARVLFSRGAEVLVGTLGEAEAMSPDAAHNLKLLQDLAAHDPEDRLHLARLDAADALDTFRDADIFVDALLGTGLKRALRPPIRDLVAWLNAQPQPTVALDVPTGLHTDTGTVLGEAVTADLTVTMAALKTGLLMGEGPRRAGHIEVVEIGIPAYVLDEAARAEGCGLCATDETVRAWLPRRPHDAHKFSAGLTLVVAGSPDYVGAPVMAATAAARIGSGYVVCAAPASIQPLLMTKLTEVTTLALPETPEGGLDPTRALDALAERLGKAQALLIGPGLGRAESTGALVRTLLQQSTLPAVLDADGLFALAGHTDLLTRHAAGRWILTPHAGEFMRLAGEEVDLTDRVRVAQTFAQRWNCVLVLKGMPSVVGCPDGRAYINGTGNPALATAGTGDVLAGLCAGLLAQGLAPVEAAVCALHLGGAAADRYARHRAAQTMLATDLLDQLPLLLREWETG